MYTELVAVTLTVFGVAALVLVPRKSTQTNLVEMVRLEEMTNAGVRAELKRLMKSDEARPEIALDRWDEPREELEDGLADLVVFERLKYTSVYALRYDPRKVLVYRQTCAEESKIDGSVIDYWYLRFLKPTGVVPEVYAISQPLDGGLIMAEHGSHTDHKLTIRKCSADRYAQVRYILMDRVYGQPVDVMFQLVGKLAVAGAARVGISIIQSIRKVHEMNVIHGDIHPANIMVNTGGAAKIIDFERAKIFDTHQWERSTSVRNCGAPLQEPLSHTHLGRWNSPWESQGCPPSLRDDIYRVLFVIAVMIHGQPLVDFFDALSGRPDPGPSRDQYTELRTQSNRMFNFDTSSNAGLPDICRAKFNISDSLEPGTDTESVLYMFERLGNLVLHLKPTDRPHYDAMISVLEEIVEATRTENIQIL